MTRETRSLIARRHLEEIGLAAFVDWAVFMLEAGYDTEHLKMLASLGHNPDSQDVEYYFERTMDELGWIVPAPEHAIRQYAQDVAQDILADTFSLSEGTIRLHRIYQVLEHPSNMEGWLYLYEDLDPDTHDELKGDDWDAAVHREAQRFLGQETKPSLPSTALDPMPTISVPGKVGLLESWLGIFRRT